MRLARVAWVLAPLAAGGLLYCPRTGPPLRYQPLDFDLLGGYVYETRRPYDMCAFGAPTRVNDWELVRMKNGQRTRFARHFPILVHGRIEVGEVWRGDQLDSLYRLEADFIRIPDAMVGG